MSQADKKGQTTVIMIVLVIVIFVGVGIFLLSLARDVGQKEYINLYVHNALLTTLRGETGYTDSECRRVSDLVACSFTSPGKRCGGDGPTCFELANQTIASHMSRFDLIRQNFRYQFIAEPEGFTLIAGGPRNINIGDASLETERAEKFTANERIQSGEGVVRAQLIVAER